MNPVATRLSVAILVTLLVTLAPQMPSPIGFWFGLAAIGLGPGAGIPRMLFPRGALTPPEELLITLLCGVLLVSGILAVLNSLAVALTAGLVAAVVLTLTYLSNATALLVERARTREEVLL